MASGDFTLAPPSLLLERGGIWIVVRFATIIPLLRSTHDSLLQLMADASNVDEELAMPRRPGTIHPGLSLLAIECCHALMSTERSKVLLTRESRFLVSEQYP